ncbi:MULTISPECIES: FKBP-type peptidyl-prolyl cis-trans isomerase [unclassified Gilliamella]|uniref:FKBP-type peptidyl-prolyl cis-trans isomerase n=1 Tax=unclassified Gilliamella TaxID=2685620 RepID=UPI00080E84C8|nr:FKBP-type peptidyl-prolyl cis-trans isomerase [Gilliamella apicola]OCG20480.1 hypothetical protein A9G23_06540 [Gilliamella apicola]OCG23728.1 hypothetical protein A9G22_05540 [Gilliamella apicola]
MKSLIKMTLVSSAIVLALAGCDDKKSSQITISTDAQKEAYALGSSFATYMKTNLEQNEIKPDQEYLISGFNETFRDASQLSKDDVKTILDAFGKRIQEESKARFEKEKTENTAAGDKFREEFAKQDGVKKTKSGLLYQILEEGSDRHPTAEDTVIVHYTGTLTDGRKFDSSYDRGEPATFPLNGVIKGWTEGIQLIGVGGKIKLVVPPDLAYGDQSLPGQEDKAGIQPASTLVFEVELLGIDGDKNQESKPSQKQLEQSAQ